MSFFPDSVIEVYHTIFNFGCTHLVSRFFSSRSGLFVEVSHPFEGRRFEPSSCTVYSHGKMVGQLRFPRVTASPVILYFKDCVATLWFVVKIRRRFGLFIGAD